MTPHIDQLRASLLADRNDANLRQWAAFIVQNDIALNDIIALIHAEHPIAMRFSWLLGGLCERNPQRVFQVVTYLFTVRNTITIKHFERSLAKMFYLAGIPPEIEGEAVDALFQWLQDERSSISTRTFAMMALDKFCLQQPELRHELEVILAQIAQQNTGSLEKKALVILGKR
jgi:hypothetical protein